MNATTTNQQPRDFFEAVEAIEKKMHFLPEGVRGLFALTMAGQLSKGIKWEDAFDKACGVVAPLMAKN